MKQLLQAPTRNSKRKVYTKHHLEVIEEYQDEEDDSALCSLNENLQKKLSVEDDADCEVLLSRLSIRSVRQFKTKSFPGCMIIDDTFQFEFGEEGFSMAELDFRVSIDDIFKRMSNW